MPTYVYYCEQCDNQFEVFQKFSDSPLSECLEGHASVRKVFVPAGIIFKGSGWYSKDSKASTSSSSSSSSNGEEKESESSESTSSESTSSESTESSKSEAKESSTSDD